MMTSTTQTTLSYDATMELWMLEVDLNDHYNRLSENLIGNDQSAWEQWTITRDTLTNAIARQTALVAHYARH